MPDPSQAHPGTSSHGSLPSTSVAEFEAAFNGSLSVKSPGSTIEFVSPKADIALSGEETTEHRPQHHVTVPPGGSQPLPLPMPQQPGLPPMNMQPNPPSNDAGGIDWTDPLSDAEPFQVVDPFSDDAYQPRGVPSWLMGTSVILVLFGLFILTMLFFPDGKSDNADINGAVQRTGLSVEKAKVMLTKANTYFEERKWTQARSLFKEVSNYAKDEGQQAEAKQQLTKLDKEETAMGLFRKAEKAFEDKAFLKVGALLRKVTPDTLASKRASALQTKLQNTYIQPLLQEADKLKGKRKFIAAFVRYSRAYFAAPQTEAAKAGYLSTVSHVRKRNYRRRKRCYRRCRRRYRRRRYRKRRSRCYRSCSKRYVMPPKEPPVIKQEAQKQAAPKSATPSTPDARKVKAATRKPPERRPETPTFSKKTCYRSCRKLRSRYARKRCYKACRAFSRKVSCCRRCKRKRGRRRRRCLYRCKKYCRRKCYRIYRRYRKYRRAKARCYTFCKRTEP